MYRDGRSQWSARTAATETRLYVDDVAVLATPIADRNPVYDGFVIGLVRSDAAGARVVVDDIVLADGHIGCH